jgi:hypothetical protein
MIAESKSLDMAIVNLLLNCNPNTLTRGGTLIHYLIDNYDTEIFLQLVKHTDIDFTIKNAEGMTSLQYAIQKSNVSAVKILLDNKCNPNIEDEDKLIEMARAVATTTWPEETQTLFFNALTIDGLLKILNQLSPDDIALNKVLWPATIQQLLSTKDVSTISSSSIQELPPIKDEVIKFIAQLQPESKQQEFIAQIQPDQDNALAKLLMKMESHKTGLFEHPVSAFAQIAHHFKFDDKKMQEHASQQISDTAGVTPAQPKK